MYKIVFVDDEAITLQLLTCVLDWEELGITVAGTASDGREAYELFRNVKPDIIIADIKMPGMNGVQLSEMIRKSDRNVKIIFLSAYAEFEYAQGAIANRVSGYLLKPLDEEELETLIRKVVAELDAETSVHRHAAAARNDDLSRRVRKAYLAWERGADESAEEIFFESPVVRCLCLIVGAPENAVNPGAMEERINLGLRAYDSQDLMPVPMNEYEFFLLIFREDITSDRIILELNRAGIFCVAGVADYRESLPETLGRAEEAAESTFASGQTIAISRAEREKMRKPEEPVLYRDCTPAIAALVETGEMGELMQYFEMCVSQLKGGSWSQTAFFAIVENVLISLKTELMRRYPETEFAENALRHVNRMRLRATLNPEGFLRFIRNLLAELAEETGKQGVSENSAVIRKARAYASRHCGEIHFSLQETADHVGLSKNHFSRVFHDATGVRFWDYVTELRIRKAAGLLTETNLPIAVIAEMCGYETEAYFNKKFKSLKGESPGKYRKRYGH